MIALADQSIDRQRTLSDADVEAIARAVARQIRRDRRRRRRAESAAQSRPRELTRFDAAAALRCSVATIDRRIRSGALPTRLDELTGRRYVILPPQRADR